MTDQLPPSEDPFAAIDPNSDGGVTKARSADPFASIDPNDNGVPKVPGVGSTMLHSAERGVVPMGTGMVGAGAGAEAGAALGLLGGPLAWATVPIGGFVGGLGGFMAGAKVGETAQSYGMKALPDSFKEAVGQDDATQQREESAHPTAAMIGGLAPYLLTMQPGAWEKAATNLAPNATALQRIMAHPVTSRLFGGGVMGGMSVYDDYSEGKPIDWTNAAISTGFGIVFNKPNKIGETIEGYGSAKGESTALAISRGALALHGESLPERFRSSPIDIPPPAAPTIADAGDSKVIGPGIDEAVSRGTVQQAPAAEAAAQAAKRAELEAFPEQEAQDVGATARQMHPELFKAYDNLSGWRDEFGKALENEVDPNRRTAIEANLAKVNAQMSEMAPGIADAHRRAADALAVQTVDLAPQDAPIVAGKTAEDASLLGSTRSAQQQRDWIEADVARRLAATGMDADQAVAEGKLRAAYYETRAARFKGALGTAEHLYSSTDAAYRAKGGDLYPPGTPTGIGGPDQPKPTGTPAVNLWNDFLAKRKDRDTRAPIETSYNPTTTKGGSKVRGKKSQAWEPGDVVDVGFTKDLLVASEPYNGAHVLVGKPNEQGKSKAYEFRPHEGLTSIPDPVDFKTVAETIKSRAAKEPAKAEPAAELTTAEKVEAEAPKGSTIEVPENKAETQIDGGKEPVSAPPVPADPIDQVLTPVEPQAEAPPAAPAEIPGLVERIPGKEGEGTEVLIVKARDGRFNVVFRDTEAQQTVDPIHIVKTIEQAQKVAHEMIHGPAADKAKPGEVPAAPQLPKRDFQVTDAPRSQKLALWWEAMTPFERGQVLDAADVKLKKTAKWSNVSAQKIAELAKVYGTDADPMREVAPKDYAPPQAEAPVETPVAAPEPEPSPAYGAGNKLVSPDRAAILRERMKEKLRQAGTQLNSGIDPEMLQIGTELAVFHMEAGARSFADFAVTIARDLGARIADLRPYLRSWYNGARDMMEDHGLDVKGIDSPDKVRTELSRLIAEDASHEPAKLDERGESPLEGTQPETLQGAGEGGQADGIAAQGGGGNQHGNGRLAEDGLQRAGGLGADAGEIPVHAAGDAAEGGIPGERGGPPVARSEQDQERDAGAGPRLESDPATGREADKTPSDFAIQDEDNIGGSNEGGGFKAKGKFKANIEAIETLRRLEVSGDEPTRGDQAILAKWVGWGGLPQAFERSDGTFTKGWEKEGAELKALLTDEQLKAAAASTRNAHYTSPEVVKGMWQALKHFGFDGGRVLEPSVGIGNFFGLMPKEIRAASALHGVELDPITGGLAKLLYPKAKIAAPMSFADYTFPDNHFDAVIGNPPFGAEKLYDPLRKDLSKFSIHNYFFAKAMDGLRPGGVMSMVVTNRFLDGAKDYARSYLAERADLVGAIRLPNNAFAKNAGTEVTTDIIFLRKKTPAPNHSAEWDAATLDERSRKIQEAGGGSNTDNPALALPWDELSERNQQGLVNLFDKARNIGEPWENIVDHVDKNGVTVPLNEYFVKHPEMMLGDFGAYGSMYRPDDAALVAHEGQDTAKMLDEAVAKLPASIVSGDKAPVIQERVPVTADLSNVRVGSMFKQDGKLFVRGEDSMGEHQAEPVELDGKTFDRVSGMIDVRDAFADLRRAQLDPNATEEDLTKFRKALNKVYDAFVKKNGFINTQANSRVFRDDPSWPQISALEDAYDRGVTPAVSKTSGDATRPESAKKAAIFTKRTQEPYRPIERAETAKDALVASLSEKGHIDLDHMEKLYGKPRDEMLSELGDLVFNDPVKGYVSADDYLSGNVKKKLAEARAEAAKDPELRHNVQALENVQPPDVETIDINVKPGAHWLPREDMAAFAQHISGVETKATFNPESNKWNFDFKGRPSQDVQTQWATGHKDINDLLHAVANQQPLTVREKQYDGTSVVLEKETQAANDKANAIKAEFGRWIFEDDTRREKLGRTYNDMFNTNVERAYDGSHLAFPSKIDDAIITLRPHQKNAVWRMMQSATTLLDHVVGAGKTYTMVAAAMEMRRTGQSKKPMFVVPNHLVMQWAKDFVKLYPGANILAASKKDFEAGNRKKLFARVSTGDYDAVIVPHSSFGKIEVDPESQGAYVQKQVDDLVKTLENMRKEEGGKSKNVKDIQKRIDDLTAKQKKLLATGDKDKNLYFKELGVDSLFVDEAHEFKNLAYSTSMQRVAGLGSKDGSQKASDLHLKVQQVLDATGGKNVVFATGTPISNTMAEMFTMQRYLDGQGLAERGLSHFDAWARMFGEVVNDWELSPAGKYKMNSRFAKFTNMPELMQRYASFADVINRDDIRAALKLQGKELPIPNVEGGKPENVVVDRSADQANYIGVPTKDEVGNETYPQGSLIYRSENLPKRPEKGADNMLKIMSDGRKAALDMRLIDPSLPDNPESKVNVAASKIKDIYDKWHTDKGAQLVFCDLSTPKEAKGREAQRIRELIDKAEAGDDEAQAKLDDMSPDEIDALSSKFSVYDDLKQKLIDQGIPENEIAFIHDANTDMQKDALFTKVRNGSIRVLMGSTAKMGAGMNVQNRLVALHHLDAPWRPSDLEQREGRIIRQGNELYERDPQNFEVGIHRYATKETLDARMWQTLEGKAAFIEQVRKGTGERTVEDIGGEAMNSAEMKAAASGNPKIFEEMQLRRELRSMGNEEENYRRDQYRVRDSIKRTNGEVASATDRLAQQNADLSRKVPEKFEISIGGDKFDKRDEAGAKILEMAAQDVPASNGGDWRGTYRRIGTYGDWKVGIDRFGNTYYLSLEGEGRYQSNAFDLHSTPQGVSMMLNKPLKDAADIARTEAHIADQKATAERLASQIKPWEKYDQLAALRQRHESLTQELRGPGRVERPLPEGHQINEPTQGQKDWTITGPDGAVTGQGSNKDLATRDHFARADAANAQDVGGDLNQGALGKITLAEGKRPVITLMSEANASTFIHETGHEWLENLLSDSNHPLAPESIKTDAQTARSWLKNDGGEITRGQHEKFARGFEQYMREGVAPSAELAGVFGKFKNWLMQIYQTIKGLGKPINADIRGVFDRMLAMEPHGTVVTPERAAGPTIHDIHEADAAETEPQHAEPVADRIVAEKEQAVQDLTPEIQNEIAPVIAKVEAEAAAGTQPDGQADGAAAGNGQVEPGGGGPEPKPGGGSGGIWDSAKLEGGGEPVSEGAGVPEPERGRDSDADAGHPLAGRPAVKFGPAESPFIDKAGNIRVENLTDAKEVGDAIKNSAERNGDFEGVRGRMTKGQMMELADDMGLSPDKMDERALGALLGGLDNMAPKVLAARKLLVASATNVSRLAKAVVELGTDHARLEFATAISRHDMIQSALSGATASWGRTGSAFHNLMGGWEDAKTLNQLLKENTGRDLYQIDRIAKLASTMDTPQQMSKFVQDTKKTGFRRMALEYWINGLISGPATHTTYMAGNLLLGMVKAGPETAAAAMIGGIRSGMGREGETVRMGEVGAQFKGAAQGFAPALNASIDAFKSGVTTLLPGENAAKMASSGAGAMPMQPGAEYATAARLDPTSDMASVAANLYASIRGARDGLLSGAALLRAGGADGAPLFGLQESPLGVIPDITVKGVNALPVGTLARAPGRFIAAIHSFFRSMNYSMDINAQAFRQAAGEPINADQFAARLADLRQNPTEGMMTAAAAKATDLTLMGQGSAFVQALSRLTNTEILGFPYLKFVDPFVHIAGNILDQSLVQRSPVGLLSKQLRADLMSKDNVTADTAMAKMLCGTILGMTMGGLASQGLASGSGPSDPRKAAMWRLAGNQAHSVRIGDVWYDTHRLGPMGMLASVSADLYDVAHKASTEDAATVASMIVHAFTQNILDESFMRGPADLIKALEDSDRYGASYARNMAASFVPYSVGMSQMARASDPYSRQARTMMDAVKAKIPGMSEELMPRRDIWGEPMLNPDALGAAGVTAIYERQMSHDPVNAAMVQLGIGPAPVERKIRNVELTEKQYDDFARIAGRATKMRLDKFVNSQDWQRMPKEIQIHLIEETLRQSREMARGYIMSQDRTIPVRAYQLKMQKLQKGPIE